MRRARILVIDDDELLLLTTKAVLEAEGYEVETHCGAFGATGVIQRSPPDLLLLDVNMPGLSGLGLLDSLAGTHPPSEDMRILLHSSNDADSLRLAVRRTAADGYVCKGDPAELRRRVEAALETPADR